MKQARRTSWLGTLLALSAVLAAAETRVRIETSAGRIVVALDDKRAPETVANFLRYVDAGRYTGGRFYRTVRTKPDNQPKNIVKIDVIQGQPAPGGQDFPPVALERTSKTGLHHTDGALSMARDGADSARGEFFICIGPQPELDFGGHRNPDGQGFAAFGRVLQGLDVVRRIQASAAAEQRLSPAIEITGVARIVASPTAASRK